MSADKALTITRNYATINEGEIKAQLVREIADLLLMEWSKHTATIESARGFQVKVNVRPGHELFTIFWPEPESRGSVKK